MQHSATNFDRYVSSAIVFAIFCVLAGGSAEESSEEKKARILKSEGISEGTYDNRVRDFGSYDEYKAAVEKGMNAAQFAKYKSQRDACKRDWSSCADNEQLVNNWSGWSEVQVACKIAANDRAKYGDPEWPWLPFGTYLTGNEYVRTGKVVAIEPDARFKNGFNAAVRVRVRCYYDVRSKHVDNVTLDER
ncbi:hypothetical protein ACQR1H_12615 [Bradyrhizobium sp. HKCCYLRH2015]|uniref:hypothetical protein n=1 Tax=Bradyrhizobium sp. HKCCYLRH2015 TaxID=3420742 RepID=UPI003EC047AA